MSKIKEQFERNIKAILRPTLEEAINTLVDTIDKEFCELETKLMEEIRNAKT